MQMGMLVKIEFEVAVTLLGAQSGLVVPRYFWAIMLNSAVLLQGNNPIIDIGMTTIVTNVCSDSHIPAKGYALIFIFSHAACDESEQVPMPT